MRAAPSRTTSPASRLVWRRLRAILQRMRSAATASRLLFLSPSARERSRKHRPNLIDAVPLLLERIESDSSIKARRQAVAMLAHQRTPDARVLPVFKRF